MRAPSQIGARFARFGLTGLIGAGLQLVLFDLLLKEFRLPAGIAAAIAVELTLCNNFIWHEQFTWGDRPAGGFRQGLVRLWRFHAANGLVSLAGNAALTWCLVEKMNAPVLPSALMAIAICAPVNFLVADRWVYGRSGARTLARRAGTPADALNLRPPETFR